MAKPTRSARGELVDFDLLKIKQQMAATPTPPPVAARENFIDQRFKRRLKKAKAAPVDTKTNTEPEDTVADDE